MFLYQIRNVVSGTRYYGITVNVKQRWAVHKSAAKYERYKSPLCNAMQSYGIDAFVIEVLDEGPDEQIAQKEIDLISSDPDCYNLHLGGHIGFDVTTKKPEEVEAWKEKLRKARAGRKPALGMKHTEDNKKLFGMHGKRRWDMHGRYPDDVLDYSFIEANKKFGISKTHYYRLRKAATK